jgi:signal transduction histidine kinase
MSITRKTILIILSVMIPLFIALLLASGLLAYKSFEDLEKKNMLHTLVQGEEAIMAKLHSLEKLTGDWSNWDDLYFYARNGNPDFIDLNMTDNTFISAEFSLVMIFDSSNRLLYSKAFDLEESQTVTIPGELLESAVQQNLTAKTLKLGTVAGILYTSSYPLLVVANPILNSFGAGPPAGTIVMGISVDDNLVKRLAETTHLSLSILIFDDVNLPSDFKTARQSVTQTSKDFIRTTDQNTITGYHVLNDITGNPVLILKIDLAKDISSRGWTTVGLVHTCLILIGIIFLVLFIFLIRRIVLSRIIVLDQTVLDISKTGDNTQRVMVTGKDELARLADNINNMLASLEESDKKINQLYEEEKKHRQELEEEGKARAQFINVLAHELRTPLTPLVVSLDMARDMLSSEPDSVRFKLLSNAMNSADSLRSRLEELLDLARFSRGTFSLKLQLIEPGVYFETLGLRYKPVLDQKGQTLKMEIAASLPQIKADPSRLEQVIINLLSNASKYSPDNSRITFRVKQEGSHLRVEVQDQGIGIPPEEISKIFLPYHRAEQDRQVYPGIGLGLAVCSQIIQAHGGRIWVESQRGQGSTFMFTIPIELGDNELRGSIDNDVTQ